MTKTGKALKIVNIVLLLIILGINGFTIGRFVSECNDFKYYMHDPAHDVIVGSAYVEDTDIIEYEGDGFEDEFYFMQFRGLKPGESKVELTTIKDDITKTVYLTMKVSPIGSVIVTGNLDFNHWSLLWTGFAASLIIFSIMMLINFVVRTKKQLYSHSTIFIGGIFIFTAAISVMNIALSLVILPEPRLYTAGTVTTFASAAFSLFIFAAIPFVIVFAILLIISNIQLLRKEGFRKVNVMGIALSAVVLAALVAMMILQNVVFHRDTVIGVTMKALQYVISALFCLALSFLLSTMICGLVSAKRVPKFDQDYIIILGCSIRKDGTLLPLLRGRVDRAIWFWRQQLEKTGKKAVLIPSGGQGSNEIMSEGAAMERYILEQGIPGECVIAETNSRTTLENMKFSKQIVESRTPDANVIFSTTNYHVFRSGYLAGQAGLKAEGIGSKTKWYFWPNAFVREFFGLLSYGWKQVLILFGSAAALFLLVFWLI